MNPEWKQRLCSAMLNSAMFSHGTTHDARHLQRPHPSAPGCEPKSLVQLNVPRYAMEALQREGLVFIRTHRLLTTTAKWGIQMWCRSDYAEPELLDCARMTFEGIA